LKVNIIIVNAIFLNKTAILVLDTNIAHPINNGPPSWKVKCSFGVVFAVNPLACSGVNFIKIFAFLVYSTHINFN
jgi:hypothetical protein